MTNICKNLGRTLESWDFFAAPILLRYHQDEQKSTKTAGCFSISIIILLIAAFSNSWLALLRKDSLLSDLTIYKETDPTRIKLNENEFVIAVSFQGLNISNKIGRYFDVEFSQQSRAEGDQAPSQIFTMKPCLREKWKSYGGNFAKMYDRANLNQAVCFSDNFTGRYGGKWASEVFQYIRIHVKECSGAGCKNSTQFQNYLTQNGTFIFQIYFINKIINPSEIKPVQKYFQDKNYFFLSKTIAIDVNLYLTEYEIITDESLWPWVEKQSQTGVFVDRTETESWIYPVQNGTYAQIYLRKSDQKMTISRQFRKVDKLLSYLGGLFGIFVFLFGFLLRYYNQCCFQLELCHQVFRCDEGQGKIRSEKCSESSEEEKQNSVASEQSQDQDQDERFNFFVYIQYLIYLLVKKFYSKINWASMKEIENKLVEIRHQLNIDLLLQKISFFSKANQCLLEQDQIKLLYLQQKFSIKYLKKQRIYMNIYYELEDDSYEQESTIQKQMSEQSKKEKSQSQSEEKFCRQSNRTKTIYFARLFGTNNVIPHEGNLEMQIIQALNLNNQRLKKGDIISKKILQGVRSDVLLRYKDRKTSTFISKKNHSMKHQIPKPFSISTKKVVIDDVKSESQDE